MSPRDHAARAIAALPAIGLDALTTDAALLARVDRKYIVPLEVIPTLVEAARSDGPRDEASVPAALEIDGCRELDYLSVYFDTPDLLSFRLAAHARRRRFKLRTRTYLDSGTVYLELKTRGARGLTVKDRDVYDGAEPDVLTAEARSEAANALEAIGVGPERADDLDARLATRYRRTTLLVPGTAGDPASRATIDLDVQWREVAGVAFALPDFAIVETKSTGRASRIDRTLWRLGYRPQRISKYATGLAALHRELPRNRWTRVLAGPLASPLVLPETTAARKDPTCFAA